MASEWIIRSGIELYKEVWNDEPRMKAAGPLYKGQLGTLAILEVTTFQGYG